MTTKAERLYNAKSAIIAATAGKGRNMTGVTFEGIAAEIAAIETGVDTSDATASAADILTSKSSYVNGVKISGTMPDNGTVSTDISAKTTEVTIAAGKHSGAGIVKISDAEQDKIISENIKKDISILGVTGSFEGGAGTGDYLVRFIDFDGVVLKEQRVNSGANATAPTMPTHDKLTFYGWNNEFTNITQDIDVGAIYNTTTGHTYLFITVNAITGLTPTVYFNKSNTATLNIYNDSTNALLGTSSASGNVSVALTLPSEDSYILRTECSGNYSFGNGSTFNRIFGNGNYRYILTNVFCGTSVNSIYQYSFRGSASLKSISLSSTITSIGTYSFESCYMLHSIIIPATVTIFGNYLFSNCYALNFAVLSKNITTLGDSMFVGCYKLTLIISHLTITVIPTSFLYTNYNQVNFKIPLSTTTIGTYAFYLCSSISTFIIPSAVTSIASQAFSYCVSILKYTILATTPPTITADTFNGINPICRIEVPAASVAAYKTATNWITYANQIFAIP